MRGFVQRALKKIGKLDPDQVHSLVQDLYREREQLSLVLDSLNDGVIVSNVLNNLVFYNKATERLVPVSPYETFDHKVWELILDRDIAELIERTLINQESIADKEFTLDAAGAPRIISFNIIPLVQSGRIQGSIILIRDISEKRMREARLRRAENLASLTTLAAGVAHEIKNPLGSIGIHIQLIQRLLDRSSLEYAQDIDRHLNVVNEEVERLNSIVMDFLIAVRPMDLHFESVNLNNLTHELLDFLKYELEASKIEVAEDFDERLPLLPMDERFLKQAILNIIKNAMSAMPDGGRLIVSTSKRGNEAMIRISDNGVGMSKAIQEKIFEPFFTTKNFGSGIGLTLVYKIIKEHRGDISVLSQEGKGSSFAISLPFGQIERPLLCWDDVQSAHMSALDAKQKAEADTVRLQGER